eukprot:TRINITY_DN16165_c0_g1_i1.p1 TRINITY_DN16165_c0_g1~~TRINITY_DN16165_c0_g1_i1.p1  ORF type:complete len:134 (+),score=37.50 TRINITY_DN16165_c0_g1_i1:64-465(+)
MDQMMELAGEAETLGEDIVAMELHRVELDKGRQQAREGWRALQKLERSGKDGPIWCMSDTGLFIKKPSAEVQKSLEEEQKRLAGLIDENLADTKQKMARLAWLENNEDLKKWSATFNLKPLSRKEASFSPTDD